jgi:hypothetical protein
MLYLIGIKAECAEFGGEASGAGGFFGRCAQEFVGTQIKEP